jgi:AraC-like DNA-binding protein
MDVPAEDRFDVWREVISRTRPSEAVSAHASDFWAECRLVELGPVTVLPLSSLPASYRRTSKMVRQSDPEIYHLSLLLDGGMALDCAERSEVLGPLDLHMVDSSRPYDLRQGSTGKSQALRGIGVDLPKALLPLPPHRLQALLGRSLSGQEGLGVLVTDFLAGVGRQADVLRPSDAARLGVVLLDLVSAWFASLVDAEDTLSPETRQRVSMERVRAFVRQNLHDPELTPAAVAAAHHISVSYLYRLFQEQSRGETLAAWIRSQRLEGARRDLAAPSLRNKPIHAIASRWCFSHASDFTRAFRTAYGLSPKQYRSLACPSTPSELSDAVPSRHRV